MLAFIFDSVGFGEWFILLAVVLIVVGPRKLPATARSIGNFYAKFRRAAEGFKRQLMDMEAEMDRAAENTAKELEMDGAFQSSGDEGSVYPDENGFAIEDGQEENRDESEEEDDDADDAGGANGADGADKPEEANKPDGADKPEK